MKKLHFLTLLLVLTLTLVGCARLLSGEDDWLCTDQGWVKHGNPSAAMPTEPCGEPAKEPVAESVDNSTESANIKVFSPVWKKSVDSTFKAKGEARVFENQFNWRLKKEDGTVLKEGQGYSNAPDMGQFGPFEIEISYCSNENTNAILDIFDYSAKDGSEIDNVSIPITIRPVRIVPGPIIHLSEPKANSGLQSPFWLRGTASSFENSVTYRLKDMNGKELAIGYGYHTDFSMLPKGSAEAPFEIEAKYNLDKETEAILDVFGDDPIYDPNCLGNKIVSIPVTLLPNTIAVKLFFANDKMDPEMTCQKVFAAERIVPKAKTMARVALEELLKGPTEAEKAQGFGTTINPGVKINRLVIVDGVAQVDFDAQMEYQVGGSCRVGMIVRQIQETLKQFPSVKEVKISINGRSEDILQP